MRRGTLTRLTALEDRCMLRQWRAETQELGLSQRSTDGYLRQLQRAAARLRAGLPLLMGDALLYEQADLLGLRGEDRRMFLADFANDHLE